MDFINRGMVFAATLLLCLFPLLIVVNALAGRPAARSLTGHTGLNAQAAADIGHLFASSAATTSAVVGTASMVFFPDRLVDRAEGPERAACDHERLPGTRTPLVRPSL
jgi:hypothetical protein